MSVTTTVPPRERPPRERPPRERPPRERPLSGRRAQAARNDQRILDAARAVFIADPGAPIAAVAKRAGVGISALYRRYRSKDDLLQRLASDGLHSYLAATEAALADDGEPWDAFTRFMRRCLDAGAGALTVRFAGNFTASADLHRAGRAAHEATQRLLDRTKAAGALRADIEVGDIALLFEQLQAIRISDPYRAGQLRHRYLALLLDALHMPSGPPLPGPPPSWAEITQRYGS
ncbi:MAG: TetR/AcrR family transcriptional regulator [Chloroflexota bacterium]